MLSVVVPAYNERKTISRCLKPIASQGCELIIVVGGKDGTDKIAKKYGKVVKDTECKGAGAARNLGAKNARGEVVLFTDGDTVVPENWAESYRKVFEDKKVVGAGGTVRPLNGTITDKIIFKMNQDWLYWLTSSLGFYQFSGNNCAYRRKDFLAANGFDEEMSFFEDTELSNRMKKRGEVVFRKDIAVRTSPRRMKKQGYLKLWLKFMLAYFEFYVLGKKPMRKYFASAG